MDLIQACVLAIIQGITEFLPVSSSAHLIFPSQILGWPDQGIAFDVAVHLGTLFAVIIYYLSDLVKIATHTIESCFTRKITPIARVGWLIIIATIPAGVIGFLAESYISTVARSIHVIAFTTIIFGLLLGLGSYVNRKLIWKNIASIEGQRHDSLRHLTLKQAIIIGFAQAVALIPGTSRSGITLTAGLFLGLRPEAAARFSFLLSIPIIIASALFEGVKVIENPSLISDPLALVLGIFLSFLTGICVIHLFMRYISKSGMAVFVIYRILLGAALFTLFLM